MPEPASDLKPSCAVRCVCEVAGGGVAANDAAPATLDEWGTARHPLRTQLQRSWGGFPERALPARAARAGRAQARRLSRREGHLPDAARRVDDGQRLRPRRRPASARRSCGPRPLAAGPSRTRSCRRGASARRSSASSCWPSTPSGPASAALGKKLGEYHGEMVGGDAVARSACRCRACRFTRTCGPSITCSRGRRSTASKIGITGASGGGNQTMYAGAFDERFGASCRSARSAPTSRT